MPKASHKTTTTPNVLTAAEIPDHVAIVFARAGEKITPELVAKLYQTTEAKRSDWLAHAILTGAVLIARQEFLPYGQFGKFLEVTASCITRDTTSHGHSIPSLKRYMTLAGRLLRPLLDPISVHGSDSTHALALRAQETGFTATSANIRALVLDPTTALPTISALIAGRSLRQLTADLQAAEESAADLEAQEAATPAKKPRGTGRETLPTANPHANQLLMDFDSEWADTVAPGLEHIDQALAGNDPALLELPPADLARYWLAVAEELSTRATRAQEAAHAATQAPKDDLLSSINH